MERLIISLFTGIIGYFLGGLIGLTSLCNGEWSPGCWVGALIGFAIAWAPEVIGFLADADGPDMC